jgi:triacylglycerol esterase/lipase EstA (alpha/beta hydrolase family)
VLQYVKSNLVTNKVAVHGESMGGSVACYIASKNQLDFAFINRTFSSISHVAFWGIGGKFASRLFNFLTMGWHDYGL